MKIQLASQMINLSEQGFRRIIELGIGPRLVRCRGSMRVRLADLYEWIDGITSVEIASNSNIQPGNIEVNSNEHDIDEGRQTNNGIPVRT